MTVDTSSLGDKGLPQLPFVPFAHHDATIGAAFQDAAERYPDRPAILTESEQLSFRRLARLAGGIAIGLRAVETDPSGQPPARVGLLLDHGATMVTAILGSLAAGWCYVPLDASYPPPRLQQMAALAQVSVILTHRRLAPLAATVAAATTPAPQVIAVEDLPPAPLEVRPVDPGQPAYVLFTSGSTGLPKGVTHSHRSVLHGITNHIDNLRITPQDRTSLVTPFSYDMSVSDLYGAVLAGAAVVPVDLRQHGLVYLARALARHGVTIYHSTPTVFRYLVDYLAGDAALGGALPAIRVVLLGGEPATRTHLALARAHFAPDCRFVNGYGATEASFSVQLHLPAGEEPPGDPAQPVLPIGTPLAGYEPVLLDEAGDPLPADAAGPAELGIRSRYLGLGYWGDPVASRQRFGVHGDCYRTGDVVRRLADGNLCYLGRADRQVKVNGHRLELGEIEARLAALPGVARAVAVARGRSGEATRLLVYAQPARVGEEPDPVRLRAELAGWLPEQVLPQQVVVLPELPLTSSGKVDVRALPDPEPPSPVVPAQSRPVGTEEQLVTRAWCEVLGVAAVGRQVSFFDAGGDSLALVRLQYRLTQIAGVELPLVRLLEHPTVAAMAAHLIQLAATESRPEAAPESMAAVVAEAASPLAAAVDRMAQRRQAKRRERAPRPAPTTVIEQRGVSR